MTFLLKSGGNYSTKLQGNTTPSSLPTNNESSSIVATDANHGLQSSSTELVTDSNLLQPRPKVVKILKSQDILLRNSDQSSISNNLSQPETLINDNIIGDIDGSHISRASPSHELHPLNTENNLVIKTEDVVNLDHHSQELRIDSVQSLNPLSVESIYQKSDSSLTGRSHEDDVETYVIPSDCDSRDTVHISSDTDVDSRSNFGDGIRSSKSHLSSPAPKKYKIGATVSSSKNKDKTPLPFEQVVTNKVVPRKHFEIPRKFDPIVGNYYGCPNCLNKFVTAECVQEHLASCTEAPLILPDKLQHQSTDKEIQYRCTLCGRDFSLQRYLRRHMTRVHKSGNSNGNKEDLQHPPAQRQLQNPIERTGKSFKCDVGICMRTFDNLDDFHSHRRTCHIEAKRRSDVRKMDKSPCLSKTNSKQADSGTPTFACDFCDETFFLKSYLDDHQKNHVIEYPFTCKVCRECFSSKSSLDSHHKQCHPSGLNSNTITITSATSASSGSQNPDRSSVTSTTSKPQWKPNQSAAGCGSNGKVTDYIEID